MARDIESLTLRMSADLRRFEKSMADMSAIADKRLTAVERQALKSQRNLSRIMDGAGRDMVAGLRRGLAELAPVLAGAFSVAQVTRYADAWTSGRNSLAAAGVAAADLAGKQEELLRVANDSRTSTEATIGLYSRLSIATQELGLSSSDTLRLTELLNKSIAASGGSAQEAASAALQLSQALASGTLQGDELRSLRENAPLIAKAIADAMGVGIGALKDLGAEGKITAGVVTRALFAASGDIEARFESTQMTVGQSLTVLDNQLGAFVGRADESLSATQRLAQGIVGLANNLDDAVDIVVVAAAVIGTTLASRAIGSAVVSFTALRAQVALTNVQLAAVQLQSGLAAGSLGRMSVSGVAAAGAMRGLSAATAFFGGPIGLLVTGLAAGIALLAVNASSAEREVEALSDEISRQATAAGTAAEETARLAGEITQTDTWAAGLTGQVHLLADAHFRAAAGAKAQAIETARLRLEEARGTLGDAQESFERRRFISEGMAAAGPLVDAYGRPRPGNGQAGAQRAAGSEEYRNLTIQTGTVKALTDNLNRLLNAPLQDFRVEGGGGGGGGGGKTGGGGRASSPSPQDLAAQREMLALQGRLEILRAQGREEDARAVQLQIDRINLEKQYSDAGVANAAQAARLQVEGVAVAEAAARGREAANERAKFYMDAATEGLAAQNEESRRRLQFEAELARLSGDEARIVAAEREVFLAERINELLARKVSLVDAEAQARGEWAALEGAGREGRIRDDARDAARTIVDVLASDNIWEEAGRRFRDAAFDNLEDLLTELFSGMNGGGQGGGLGGALGSALKGLIPGFASGTSSAPGGLAYVHQGEVLANLPKGTSVIPAQVVRAMASMPSAGSGGVLHTTIRIDLSGANGDETIRRIAGQAAMEGARRSYAQAMRDSRRALPSAQKRLQQLGTT